MVLIALILLLFNIFMFFSLAFGWCSYYISWFGDEFLTYCMYVVFGSLPIIWLTFLSEPYSVSISNSKEIAKDLADEIEKRNEGK